MNHSEKYNESDIQMARIAKALSHPARVQIIKFLAEQENCFCGNIVDYIPLSQSTVSQHIKELKGAGLIDGSYQPPKIYYCINKKNWETARALFAELFDIKINSVCNIEVIK